MALIRKEIVPPQKAQISIRLNPDAMGLLEQYCRFIEGSPNYVVESSLRLTFAKDRSFQEWLLHDRSTGGSVSRRMKRSRLPESQ
jgi:hypothetical protein